MSGRHSAVRLSHEVEAALADGRPVVALESTITSSFGLPAPHNRDCFERVDRAIRAVGAVPAVTGVLDGRMIAGVEEAETFAERVRVEADRLKVTTATDVTVLADGAEWIWN